jgi:hypothetical protein
VAISAERPTHASAFIDRQPDDSINIAVLSACKHTGAETGKAWLLARALGGLFCLPAIEYLRLEAVFGFGVLSTHQGALQAWVAERFSLGAVDSKIPSTVQPLFVC